MNTILYTLLVLGLILRALSKKDEDAPTTNVYSRHLMENDDRTGRATPLKLGKLCERLNGGAI